MLVQTEELKTNSIKSNDGAAVGVAAGAVTGRLAGKAVAEHINPTVEHAYWRSIFTSRTYFIPGDVYEQYGPAYQFGWESEARHSGKSFLEVESRLHESWDKVRGTSTLAWDHAKNAVRDAWERVSRPAESPASTSR